MHQLINVINEDDDDSYFTSRFLNAIQKHFLANPSRPALINARDPADRITFGELYLYGHSIAAFLRSRSFGCGDIACLALPNCWQYIAIFVGAMSRGGAISGASPIFTDRELKQQFSDSNCKVVFCSSQNITRVLEAAKGSSSIQTIVVITDDHFPTKSYPATVFNFYTDLRTKPPLAEYQNQNINQIDQRKSPEKELLLLHYSSGTTGSPKGVMISHRNFNAEMTLVNRHFDRHIVPVFDPAFIFNHEHQLLLLPFYHCYGIGMASAWIIKGSTGVVLDSFDPDIFCRTIQQFKIRMLATVPPILIFLTKNAKVAGYDLTSLSVVVDLTTGLQLGPMESGEVCIRGPTVMMGYLGNPKATGELIDHEGWLHTGDIDYADDDQNLYIVERMKELIKVNGFQVAPAELEDLLFSHPHIQDCAVIGVADQKTGELPKAFIVKKNGSKLSEREVHEFVKERVARYKQFGGGVEFVNEIPKSAAGKILRKVLREWHYSKMGIKDYSEH